MSPSKDQLIRRGEMLLRVRPAMLGAMLKFFLASRRLELRSPHGIFWIDPATTLGLELLKHGEYEAPMLETLRSYLTPGDTFVDLGANEGFFSVVGAGLVGANGLVIAIEPQDRMQPVLRRNLDLNQVANTRIYHAAISDRSGRAALHLTPGVNSGASSFLRPTRYPVRRQQVDCLPLSELFRRAGIKRCGLLKIDVEGWEYEVIMGSRELFESRSIRAIALELHPHILGRRGFRIGEIEEFLIACGYRPDARRSNLVFVAQD